MTRVEALSHDDSNGLGPDSARDSDGGEPSRNSWERTQTNPFRPKHLLSHPLGCSDPENAYVIVSCEESDSDEAVFAARVLCRSLGMTRKTGRMVADLIKTLAGSRSADQSALLLAVTPLAGPLAGVQVLAADPERIGEDVDNVLAGHPRTLNGWRIFTAARLCDEFSIEPPEGPLSTHMKFKFYG